MIISKKNFLQKLCNYLEIKPLNTTKYLNFVAFKKAFLLYVNKNQNVSLKEKSLLFEQILALKNSMNTLRINYPEDHRIIITPYCLIGFIEGDGSFSVSSASGFPLRFLIVQVIT